MGAFGKLFSGFRGVAPFDKFYEKPINLKIFWFFTVLTLLICFTIHFYFQIERFLSYEKVTDALVVDNGFEFPDVTICPTQPFDSKKYNELDIANTYQKFFDSWKAIIGKSSSFKQNADIWEASRHSLGMLLPTQRPKLFRSLQSQLVYCQYNGYLCDHTNFTTYPVPGRKNCFLLKSKERKLKQSGENEGLYLIFNTNNSTAFLTSTEKLSHYVGYSVDLHPRETRPQFSTASFVATVNEQTNVEVSMTTINDVSTPIDVCQTDKRTINVVYDFITPSKKSNNFSQVLGDCREDELQLQLDINCNCVDETFVISDTTRKSLCHKIPDRFWQSMDFDVKKLYNKEKSSLRKKANCYIDERNNFRNFYLDTARCYNPCDKVIYSKTISVNKLPDSTVINNALKEINKEKGPTSTVATPNIPQQNEKLVSIKIFPPTLSSMKYKKKLEFDWVELLSEGGGIIGLWVGWCILTLFELIEACFAGKVCPEDEQNNNDDANTEIQNTELQALKTNDPV